MEQIYLQPCDFSQKEGDVIDVFKDFDNEVGFIIKDNGESTSIYLTQEHAKELALAILDKLDI